MRLSIWQQFSGNHSGGFDIVGVFESAEAAAQAAAQLGEILSTIAGFREDIHLDHDDSLTWPEREFSVKHGVEWSHRSIDWIKLATDGTPLNQVIMDQYLFISNLEIDNTWLNSVPVGALIERLGSKALISESFGVYSGNVIAFTVTCTAPDIETAQAIHDEVESHLAIARSEKVPESSPWLAYVAFSWYNATAFHGHIRREGTLLHLMESDIRP